MPKTFLLTPGPLTTSDAVKQAMLGDWGSRDASFVEMGRRVRRQLLEVVHAQETHHCVPLQGSGTFVVEAAIGTLLPPEGKLAVLVNGAYGRRMLEICRYLGRSAVALTGPEDEPNDPGLLERALADDEAITHVAMVHCETTSGVANPLAAVSALAARAGRALIVDAMSSYAGIPIDARSIAFDALLASSNKCLEGVPGLGFALVRRGLLDRGGHAHSLSLDLAAQWRAMEGDGQWRFTPPTQVVAALARALSELAEEGGVKARNRRYRENCQVLVEGMRGLGFRTLLEDAVQAPIIVTFPTPAGFDFPGLYQAMAGQGFVIYPGKLTQAESFRIGCIGRLGPEVMQQAIRAVERSGFRA